MGRRRFDHFHVELSVRAGTQLPRYRLWLAVREAGGNPDALTREALLSFCDAGLRHYLHGCGVSLSVRGRARLRRSLVRFDPAIPTPEEHFARLT